MISTANLAHESDTFSTENRPETFPGSLRMFQSWEARTFDGYHRADGSVGTANHWIVLPLVFCENRNLAMMREALDRALGFEKSTHYQAFANRLVELQMIRREPR